MSILETVNGLFSFKKVVMEIPAKFKLLIDAGEATVDEYGNIKMIEDGKIRGRAIFRDVIDGASVLGVANLAISVAMFVYFENKIKSMDTKFTKITESLRKDLNQLQQDFTDYQITKEFINAVDFKNANLSVDMILCLHKSISDINNFISNDSNLDKLINHASLTAFMQIFNFIKLNQDNISSYHLSLFNKSTQILKNKIMPESRAKLEVKDILTMGTGDRQSYFDLLDKIDTITIIEQDEDRIIFKFNNECFLIENKEKVIA